MSRYPDDAAEQAARRRHDMIVKLRNHVHELAVSYEEGHARGPGLLGQLEHPRMQLQRPELPDGSKRSGKPGSRILPRPDLMDHAAGIRNEALYWAYRCGWNGTNADTALRTLPDLLVAALDRGTDDITDDDLPAILSQFGIFVSTCRTALAYRAPSTAYPDATCPSCKQHSIQARVEEQRGWCSNPECPGENGRRMEWTGLQLRALIRDDRQAREAS